MKEKTIDLLFRRKILNIIVILFFAVSCFKLFNMQILESPIYEEKSAENSIKKRAQQAPRGIFYDRNGKVIVTNKPTFTLRITPDKYDTKLNGIIEKHIDEEPGYIEKILYENRMYSKYQPRIIKRNVGFNFIAWYEENFEKLPGVEYRVDLQRDYSYGIKGAHVFGYNREISAEMLEKNKDVYDMGDIVGYTGIERAYEDVLRGKKGINYTLVDSRQRTVGPYLEGKNDINPEKGYDLILTLDAYAQKAAEEALEGKTGAVVAIEPSTGEVLAMVSAPEYDLSELASVTSRDAWSKLQKDENKPLINRASTGFYPPGSTVKMMQSLIALQEGVIDPSYSVVCKGGYQYGNRFFRCTHVHGYVDIEKSIEQSCNTFYYQLILKIGLDRWAKYLEEFGFGKRTGLDIGREIPGLVPDSDYYDRVWGKGKWTEGFIVSLGIGQGELSVTPLQLAQYTALLANYGKTYRPHVVKGYVNNMTGELNSFRFDSLEVPIERKYFDIVREGMYKVVQGEGTGRWIRDKDITIAGKTGTAQNPHGEDHALFIAFAPYENPQIAIAVIVENVGYGSTHAAPVARDVIKAYLQKDESKLNTDELLISGN